MNQDGARIIADAILMLAGSIGGLCLTVVAVGFALEWRLRLTAEAIAEAIRK